MLAAQRRDDELKELEKQRIDLIEGQCLAHSAGLKTPVVPGDVNHLLVGVTLSEIPGIILAECQKRADMEAKAAEPKVNPVPEYINGFHEIPGPDPCPEWVGCEISYPVEEIPVMAVTSAHISPPLPPAPRPIPPMPPAITPTLYDVVLKLPCVTVEQATALKTFMATKGITYEIFSQEEVRGAF